jgi:hypothetical protein
MHTKLLPENLKGRGSRSTIWDMYHARETNLLRRDSIVTCRPINMELVSWDTKNKYVDS